MTSNREGLVSLGKSSGRTIHPAELQTHVVVALVALLACFGFASAPVLNLLGQLPKESLLTHALSSGLGGITLPVVACFAASAMFGEGSKVRRDMDRSVGAGVSPPRAIAGPLMRLLIVNASALALTGAVLAMLLRRRMGLEGLGREALWTGYAIVTPALAWTAIASCWIVRSGKRSRLFWVIGLEVLSRLIPGPLAWISPTSHLTNLLGAQPPRSIVPVPVLSQSVSIVLVSCMAIAATACVLWRYQGSPKR